MAKITAKLHLKKDVDKIELNMVKWIKKAVTISTSTNVSDFTGVMGSLFGAVNTNAALVETWFGQLDSTHLSTLRANLNLMKSLLENPKTSIRIVDAPNIVGDTDYYAQVRGRYNAMRPVLSVEVADQWKTANLDTKVNTFFHELSHRILATKDLGPNEGYSQMMYGVTNAQDLANDNPAHALINAENYGYFIALANGLTDQAP